MSYYRCLLSQDERPDLVEYPAGPLGGGTRTPMIRGRTGQPAGRPGLGPGPGAARPGDRYSGICNRHSGVFPSSLFAIKARHNKNMNDLVCEYITKGADLPPGTRETWNLVVDSLNTWPPGC